MPNFLSRVACLALGLLLPVMAQQNVVLSSTHPDIIYNPPLCNSSPIVAGCTSPWRVSNDTILGTTVVYTNGPITQAANVIPQMFLNFRASALYLRTTSSSNATVKFALITEPSDVSMTTTVNTTTGLIIAANIPESQTTILNVTFLQGGLPTRFVVESIRLTVTNPSATSSFLPSPSLPGSSFPLVIASPSTVLLSPSLGTKNKATSMHAITVLCAILVAFLL